MRYPFPCPFVEGCLLMHDASEVEWQTALMSYGIKLHQGHHSGVWPLADKLSRSYYDERGFFSDEECESWYRKEGEEERAWRASLPYSASAIKSAIGLGYKSVASTGKLTLEQVKERLDIYEMVEQFTILKGRGDKYMGKCPLHEDKTSSFSVDRKKKLWHCFGCGEGGDAIRFIERKYGKKFSEALDIARRLVE
jgi:hypothetical protein